MNLDFLTEDGRYISASRASEKTGYASDYIGQLCRAGKIPGKLVGRTWFVDFPSLVSHKQNRHRGRRKKSPAFSEAGATATAKAIGVFSRQDFAGRKSVYEADSSPLLPLLRSKVSKSKKSKGEFGPAKRTGFLVLYFLTAFTGATVILDFWEEIYLLSSSLVAAPIATGVVNSSDLTVFLKEVIKEALNIVLSL